MKNIIAASFLFLSGCTVMPINIPVKVYNLDSGDVLSAVFKWSGRAGVVTATTPTGLQCNGEYLTFSSEMAGSSSSWGSIYGYGVNGFSSATSGFRVSRGAELGEAILRCDDKNIIQCEYVVNSNNKGIGYCRDKSKQNYKFSF